MSGEEADLPPLIDYVALVRPKPSESKIWTIGIDASNNGFVFENNGVPRMYIHNSGRAYVPATTTILSPAISGLNRPSHIPRINKIHQPNRALFENQSQIRLNKEWSIGQLRPIVYNARYDVNLNLVNVTHTQDNGFTLLNPNPTITKLKNGNYDNSPSHNSNNRINNKKNNSSTRPMSQPAPHINKQLANKNGNGSTNIGNTNQWKESGSHRNEPLFRQSSNRSNASNASDTMNSNNNSLNLNSNNSNNSSTNNDNNNSLYAENASKKNLNSSLSIGSVGSSFGQTSSLNDTSLSSQPPVPNQPPPKLTSNLHSQLQRKTLQTVKQKEEINVNAQSLDDANVNNNGNIENGNFKDSTSNILTYYPCREHNHNHVWYWVKLIQYFENRRMSINDFENMSNPRIRSESLQREYNYRNYSTEELLKLSVQCSSQPTPAS